MPAFGALSDAAAVDEFRDYRRLGRQLFVGVRFGKNESAHSAENGRFRVDSRRGNGFGNLKSVSRVLGNGTFQPKRRNASREGSCQSEK